MTHAPDEERTSDTESGVARERLALVPLAFATGAALVVYIVAGISLLLGLGAAVVVFAVVARQGWRRLAPEQRRATRRRIRVGLIAGVAATATYDLVRPIHVWVEGLDVWPFKAFELFGLALIGEQERWLVLSAGTAFHVVNGLAFAVAYCLLIRRPGVASGVVFALLLEGAMLVTYPQWLGLEGLMGQFVRMSLVGHLAYGAVLGLVAGRLTVTSTAPMRHDPVREGGENP